MTKGPANIDKKINIKKMLGWILILFFCITSEGYTQDKPSLSIDDETAHNIILSRTPEDVKNLIQSGYDVNKVYQCLTPLIMAIKSASNGGNAHKHPTYALEKIKILVNAGADINLVPCPGESMSALHWAVSLPSQLQDVEYDVNNAIDEMIKNKTGECNFPGVVTKPCGEVTLYEREKITMAIKGAMKLAYDTFPPYFMEIIKFLVNEGGDINLKAGTLASTPIYSAAMNPQEISLEPLKYLIEKGAEINIQNIKGDTPLFWAQSIGNDKAVDMLINAGANTTIRNNDGALYNEVKAQKQRAYRNERGDITLETY